MEKKNSRKRGHIKPIDKLRADMELMGKKLRKLQEEEQRATDADNSDTSSDSDSVKENDVVERSTGKDVGEEETLEPNETLESLNLKTNEISSFLGAHPDDEKVGEADLLKEVADRIQIWMSEGIPKEEKNEILKLVPRKHGQCNMNAPILNDEISSNLKPDAVKRDKYFFNYQNMIGSSLSLTAAALSMILNEDKDPIDRELLLQSLADAVKINSDLFHSWTIARKIYITPTFDGKIKTVLDKTKPTEFLFGDNVKELVNKVKTIEQVGKDLKPVQNRNILKSNNSLNWKSSSAKKEVGQMNYKSRNYYTSRNSQNNNYRSRGARRPQQQQHHQRDYTQAQPMQNKK